jgi:hypothetical protein
VISGVHGKKLVPAALARAAMVAPLRACSATVAMPGVASPGADRRVVTAGNTVTWDGFAMGSMHAPGGHPLIFRVENVMEFV